MLVEFDDMPGNSRVWIFQSERPLTSEEVVNLDIESKNFLQKWSAHGNGLKSAAKVFHDRFLVITTDEEHARASGCSIDAMTRFVRGLDDQYQIGFFDRTHVAFIKGSGVETRKMHELKDQIASGSITNETPTFNNLITHKEELEKNWILPASKTWLSRYF